MEIFHIILYNLIAFNLILCGYEQYENHFSIFFNRERTTKKEDNFGDEIIYKLLFNNIFTSIKLGNNQKHLNILLTFNNSNIKLTLPSFDQKKQLIEKDKFIFPRTNKELNLYYNINTNEKIDNNSYIGLSLYENDNNKYSFINQLKENKIIEKRIFSVLYKEQSIIDDEIFDGQILFGLYPHNMTYRYNEYDLNWISILDNKWKIKFDEIKYNNNEILNINEIEFDIGINLIVGPEEYRIKLYNNYLKNYIDKKICKEEVFYHKKDNQFYLAYSCKSNIIFENFPTLNIYKKELNYSIIIGSEQLLCVYYGRTYFKIVFKKKGENKKWIFGRTFMEVYPLVFDLDNKKIGFYKIKISGDYYIFVSIFLSSIFIIIFMAYFRGLNILKNEKLNKEKNEKDNNDINVNEKSKLKNE